MLTQIATEDLAAQIKKLKSDLTSFEEILKQELPETTFEEMLEAAGEATKQLYIAQARLRRQSNLSISEM